MREDEFHHFLIGHLQEAFSLCHAVPLHLFINYIEKSICPRVALLGIQGVNIELGEGITPEVEEGANIIAKILIDLLNI